MKTLSVQKSFLAIAAAAGLALSTVIAAAQNAPANAAPPLSQGVPEVLQLARAKISDDTIVAYIRNTGNSYSLDPNQIIYLRLQGVSENVINFMLNQPRIASTPAQSATQPGNSYNAPNSTGYTQPPVTYNQGAPPPPGYYPIADTDDYYGNVYYAQPYYYPYYYTSYPTVTSFGFGRGFRGGFHGVGVFHGAGGGFALAGGRR